MKSAFVARRSIMLILLALASALNAGCGPNERAEQKPNLRALAAYYSQYQAKNRGRLPASEKDFQDYIRASDPEAAFEALFTSNRDGKPFIVKYRGDKSWPLPGAVIYEQDGRGGVRHVATPVGGYAELSDEEFRQQMARVPAKR